MMDSVGYGGGVLLPYPCRGGADHKMARHARVAAVALTATTCVSAAR